MGELFPDGYSQWLSSEESTCQCRRYRFDTCVRKIPWRRKWQPTAVFLSGKSHGQRSLVAYIPWGHKKVGHDLATKQQHVKKACMERLHHILITNTMWWDRLKGPNKCRRKYRMISSCLPFLKFRV